MGVLISLSQFRQRKLGKESSKGTSAELAVLPRFDRKCVLKKGMLVFNDGGYAFEVPEEVSVYFTTVENESGVQYLVYTVSPEFSGVSISEEMALYRYLAARFGH